MNCFAFISMLILVSASTALPAEMFNNEDVNKNWAVLVAGSNGFWNYRHQADVAHAYQVLRSKNFPPEKIIVMMYDDVASDPDNPFPGKLFNNESHIDCYAGLKIDYRGADVNSRNFLKVLTGDKELKSKGKRVLESTAEDNVFVFFSDHGGPDLICFPESDLLYSRELNDALIDMEKKQMFKKLVIYLEACESGSMFKPYKLSQNVYAVTASNPDESSYGCYCFDEIIPTCLGDLFSVSWIHDTETHVLKTKTLQQQYESVKKLTAEKSHVMQYGNVDIAKATLDQYFGQDRTPSDEVERKIEQVKVTGLIDSRDAHLVKHLQILHRSRNPAEIAAAKEALKQDALITIKIEKLIARIVGRSVHQINVRNGDQLVASILKRNPDALATDCYEQLVKNFSKKCYTLQKYPAVFKNLFKLKNLCHEAGKIHLSTETILTVLEKECNFN